MKDGGHTPHNVLQHSPGWLFLAAELRLYYRLVTRYLKSILKVESSFIPLTHIIFDSFRKLTLEKINFGLF